MATLAQILANQANAQKSTGPRTLAGKEASRANAYKHGFSAKILQGPFDDPEVAAKRKKDLEAEFNPYKSPSQSWLIDTALNHSLMVDRVITAKNARHVRAVKKAVIKRRDQRVREVERATRLLPTQPDKAVRLLRQTSLGCEWLVECFTSQRIRAKQFEWTLKELATLHSTAGHAMVGDRWRVKGRIDPDDMDFLSPFYAETLVMQHYAITLYNVKQTANPEKCPDKIKELFHGRVQLREAAKASLPQLEAEAIEASQVILIYIDGIINELAERRDVLKQEEDAEGDDDLAAAVLEAFDLSDEGHRLNRYLFEHLNGYHKATKLLRGMNKGVESNIKHGIWPPKPEPAQRDTPINPDPSRVLRVGIKTQNEPKPTDPMDPNSINEELKQFVSDRLRAQNPGQTDRTDPR